MSETEQTPEAAAAPEGAVEVEEAPKSETSEERARIEALARLRAQLIEGGAIIPGDTLSAKLALTPMPADIKPGLPLDDMGKQYAIARVNKQISEQRRQELIEHGPRWLAEGLKALTQN